MSATAGKIKAKTIGKMVGAPVPLNITLSSAANTFTITEGLTTKLQTAGNGGAAVPLAAAAADTQGVMTTATWGKVSPVVTALDDHIKDGSDRKVYAKIVNSGSVYSLAFFVNINGTETAHTLATGSYKVFIPYNFAFDTLPNDALLSLLNVGYAALPQAQTGQQTLRKGVKLTVAVTNTLPNLADTPINIDNMIFCFGGYMGTTLNGVFSVSGQTITFYPLVAGFTLEVGEEIEVIYDVAV